MINFVFSTINKTLETRLVFWNFLLNHWMLLLKLHTRISFHRTEVAEIASSIPDGQFGHNICYYLLKYKQPKNWDVSFFFLEFVLVTQMISISNSGESYSLNNYMWNMNNFLMTNLLKNIQKRWYSSFSFSLYLFVNIASCLFEVWEVWKIIRIEREINCQNQTLCKCIISIFLASSAFCNSTLYCCTHA